MFLCSCSKERETLALSYPKIEVARFFFCCLHACALSLPSSAPEPKEQMRVLGRDPRCRVSCLMPSPDRTNALGCAPTAGFSCPLSLCLSASLSASLSSSDPEARVHFRCLRRENKPTRARLPFPTTHLNTLGCAFAFLKTILGSPVQRSDRFAALVLLLPVCPLHDKSFPHMLVRLSTLSNCCRVSSHGATFEASAEPAATFDLRRTHCVGEQGEHPSIRR